jgi:hypothetical protein
MIVRILYNCSPEKSYFFGATGKPGLNDNNNAEVVISKVL